MINKIIAGLLIIALLIPAIGITWILFLALAFIELNPPPEQPVVYERMECVYLGEHKWECNK